MATTADEITIEFSEEDGTVVTKELSKEILTRGSWVTIMFKYQEWDKAKEAYREPKYSIRRYQKQKGEFRSKSKFNISSGDQAKKIIAVLEKWMAEDAGASEAE